MASPKHPPARTRVLHQPETEVGGLEGSLLQLLQNHQHSSIRLREQTERAKKESIRNAKRVSDLLVDALNGGVQDCYVVEKSIEIEIRTLAATIAKFMKQTDHWLATTNAMNSAMKEIGDFENWMKTMDFDCKSINAAIRNIYEE
ncbi:hypothetical protein Ddye_000232 [Dipteronia dyeriana]|uniref:Biogenesis of lysosome-related organelles complex 1 subunit 1 n=1 Tax=Dipteronia dyeriana TaxID=168575 RepID=A0AAD9XMK0_9ROSI|nr:hypothetical protein Ddye_000232 [Dipteronia dyeriana]